MEIEEVKRLWAESNRKLEASLRLNTALLTRGNLRKTGARLRWLSLEIAVELIADAIAIVAIGIFIGAHLHEPRFLAPAALLDLYAIAIVIAQARQLAEIDGVDYGGPVVAIQTKLERLRLRRIRTTLGILLFAPLMWVPMLIVVLRGVFGIDVYAAGSAWLAANALFGVAVIPAAFLLARRYGGRLAQSTWMRGFADAIAGRSLAAAIDSLAEIRRFEG
ncbi:MAG TPA: hypothetical protein VFE16_11165 [Candidatus Cybelea sp.]|nr:hypothetical protein [Candidatus Cybelea sp.]